MRGDMRGKVGNEVGGERCEVRGARRGLRRSMYSRFLSGTRETAMPLQRKGSRMSAMLTSVMPDGISCKGFGFGFGRWLGFRLGLGLGFGVRVLGLLTQPRP